MWCSITKQVKIKLFLSDIIICWGPTGNLERAESKGVRDRERQLKEWGWERERQLRECGGWVNVWGWINEIHDAPSLTTGLTTPLNYILEIPQ